MASLCLLAIFVALCMSSSYMVGAFSAAAAHSHQDNKEREIDGSYRSRDSDHYGGDGHNVDFDHEAIIGSVREAEEFDKLPVEEAKRRLEALLPLIDVNKDKLINRTELKLWILNNFAKLSAEEAQERLKESDANRDGKLNWTEYLKDAFGVDSEEEVDPEDTGDNGMLLQGEKEMWAVADKNQDGILDFAEFSVFANPEENAEMHPFLVAQTLREKDTDNDGKISYSEFIQDRMSGHDGDREWMASEQDKFTHELDINKDGYLDRDEIKAWLIPDNEEIAIEEVDHLFASADDNSDDRLSYSEILDHHDMFVGSEVTSANDLEGHFEDEL